MDEPSPVGGGVGVDSESESVDGHMMVIPAKEEEVGGVVVAAVLLFSDVVDLQPVTGPAA